MTLNHTGLGVGITPSTNLHISGNAIITNQLQIGNSSTSANLALHGTLGYGFQSITSDTTLSDSSLNFINSSSGNVKVTLPYAGNVLGRIYSIKKTSPENTVFIHGDFIDNSYAISLAKNSLQYAKVMSTGNQQWSLLSTSGNGGLWTPAAITTSAWYDASDFSSMLYHATTGNVTQWNDKSGNDNHLTQADQNLQPPLVGKKLEFVQGKTLTVNNGTNMLIASGNHSIFFVHDVFDPITSTATYPNIIRNFSDGAGVSNRRPIFFYVNTNSRFFQSYNSSGGAYATSTSYLGTRVISGTWNNGTGTIYFDGASAGTENIANATETTHVSFTLGDNSNQNLTINFYEFIFLAQEVDTSTNQKIEGYLAWKWGLEDNLDAAHPYKTHPPSL